MDPEAAFTFTGPRTLRMICAPDATVTSTSVSYGTWMVYAMVMLRMRDISLPMRMVSPRCSMGGFEMVSFSRFCGLSNPKPEARTSACTDTVRPAVPEMSTSPAALESSRRTGPVTVKVRTKLPPTDGPVLQPAETRTAASSTSGKLRFRWRAIPPPETQETRSGMLH